MMLLCGNLLSFSSPRIRGLIIQSEGNNVMIYSPLFHCDCCGLPVDQKLVDVCPRCGYPIDAEQEQHFLEVSIGQLQRVAQYGGAHLTVAGLIRRYQARLHFLSGQKIQLQIGAEAAIGVAPTGGQGGPTQPQPALAQTDPSLPASAGGSRGDAKRAGHSFTVDQGITLSGMLGAFLGLLAAISFILNAGGNLLLALLVAVGLHVVFGAASVLVHRFPGLRALSLVCTIIYALSVPILGYAAYNWMAGAALHLSAAELIIVAAAYGTVVYGALAIYQRSALFGYFSLVALVVVDLGIARQAQLGYWWWPSMLMLLALLFLAAQYTRKASAPQRLRQIFAGSRASLYEAAPPLMYVIVAIGIADLGVTTLYALQVNDARVEGGIRLSILITALLLTLWDGLYVWVSMRLKNAVALTYLLLACVLAFCYTLDFQPVGYAVALTLLALLYHGLNRKVGRKLLSFGVLDGQLELLALVFVALVPLISDPILPFQVLTQAFAGRFTLPTVSMGWETVVELLAMGVGALLTISVMLYRANSAEAIKAEHALWSAPAEQAPKSAVQVGSVRRSQSGAALPWVLLLSGTIFVWGCEMAALATHIAPLWAMLGLALVFTAAALIARARWGARWSAPLDMLALIAAILTLFLSAGQPSDLEITLALCFAALSYGVLLFQRRQVWLFLPVVFALYALPWLFIGSPLRANIAFLLAVLLPFVAVGMRRLLTNRSPSLPQTAMAWEWPLLAVAIAYGFFVSFYDLFAPLSIAQLWLGIAYPVALEMATLAVAWYVAAALGRARWWQAIGLGFAVAALFIPTNSFWALAAIAFVGAALAVGIGRLGSRNWSWPWYVVSFVAAATMGMRGYELHQMASFWTLLAFAALSYALAIVEDQDVFLWLAPIFATWSVFAMASWGDLYRPVGVVVLCALCGMGTHFISGRVGATFAKRGTFALSLYVTALAAALLTVVYGALFAGNHALYLASLIAFALLAIGIMLVERFPQMLLLPYALAVWTIWQWIPWPMLPHQELGWLLLSYSLLNALVFAGQFAWNRLLPAERLPLAKTWHCVLALVAQAVVVLALLAIGGVGTGSGLLGQVGAVALCELALLLCWRGWLHSEIGQRRYSYYGGGFLLSLVAPWELSVFGQTNLSLLALVPASYLTVVAPFLARDEGIPGHASMAQAAAIVGSSLLLLPTLWLSVGEGNFNPTLILASEAMALLVLGIVVRMRVFVLAGAGLVALAGLRALFLQSLGIPTSLALAILGLTFLVVATALALSRRRLQAAWAKWD